MQSPFSLFFFLILRLVFQKFVIKLVGFADGDAPGDCRYGKKYCSNQGNHAQNLGEVVWVEPVKQKAAAKDNNNYPYIVNDDFDDGDFEAAFCVEQGS